MLETLKKYWGYERFRPMQEEIISEALAGRDVLAVLPTGGGKSVCFQVPALMRKGICIVVTPLIALMKDQVQNLRDRGIGALAVHVGMTRREIDYTLDNAIYGDYKFLYVSPERLRTELFRVRLLKMDVSLLAVDEAHCISQWGYDFRPDYLEIAAIRQLLGPAVPVMALTATATPQVAADIMDKLGFKKPNLLTGDFARPNLSYIFRETDDKMGRLLKVCRGVKGSGIVYVARRKSAEDLAAFLRAQGESAECYHAGLPRESRARIQDAWKSGETRIIVSTNAFGMGIDKPDVRFVIHYNMPANMENYYQEAGRAGRDGLPSDCILLYSDWDIAICRFFISRAGFIPDDKQTVAFLTDSERATLRRIERERLRQMQLYAGHRSCLRGFMLGYFGEHAPKFCGKCSYCLSLKPFADRTTSLVPGVFDENLYKELRALRKELADKKHVSAHKIISTTALRDMALVRPTTFAALLFIREISLIGAFRYGKYFLRDIRTWVATH